MAIKDPWELAQAEAAKLPPYLAEDELTADRYYEKNKERMSKTEATEILNRLAAEGLLDKQERRRKGKSGGHVFVYVRLK